MKRRVLVFVIALAMIFTLSACRSADAPPPQTNDGASAPAPAPATPEEPAGEKVLYTMWFAAGDNTVQLENPWRDVQGLWQFIVFESLIWIDATDGSWAPALASNLEISADGTVYTFTIRDGAKWHDGTPVTPDDVVFSYNTLIKDPLCGFANRVAAVVSGAQEVFEGTADTVSGIKTDGNKVIFELTGPNRMSLVSVFAFMRILPKHLLADVDPVDISTYTPFWTHPIGSGPYMIDEVSLGNYFTVVKNPDFAGPQPDIDKVVFTNYQIGGPEALSADLIAGNVDFTYGQLVNDINIATNITSQNADTEYVLMPSPFMRFLCFSLGGGTSGNVNPDMAKPEVRQAINLLLDKEVLSSFYSGQATPLTTGVSPASPNYNKSIPLHQRDVETAKKMLEDAGFDFSKTLRLLYYYDDPTSADFVEVLKANFADGGISLETHLAAGDAFAPFQQTGDFDIQYAGYAAPTPMSVYDQWADKGTDIDAQVMGDIEFKRATYNALMDKYNAAGSDAEAQAALDEIQVAGLQYCHAIPLYTMNKIAVYNKAKVSVPDAVFASDYEMVKDYKFAEWKLLK